MSLPSNIQNSVEDMNETIQEEILNAHKKEEEFEPPVPSDGNDYKDNFEEKV